MYGRKTFDWSKKFHIQILMGLHVLRTIETDNHVQTAGVCGCFQLYWKTVNYILFSNKRKKNGKSY